MKIALSWNAQTQLWPAEQALFVLRFSGEVGEERVQGSRRASFCSPEKTRKKTPVLQANLMANLQSEKNALQPGKKLVVWYDIRSIQESSWGS